uniref:Uncharacterized protein n=1 Tax=Triticum urartu TaxID=4572 RepID=A0A8R7PVB8_TRIUA
AALCHRHHRHPRRRPLSSPPPPSPLPPPPPSKPLSAVAGDPGRAANRAQRISRPAALPGAPIQRHMFSTDPLDPLPPLLFPSLEKPFSSWLALDARFCNSSPAVWKCICTWGASC